MGSRIRSCDWRASPLGEPEGWPQALKTLVALMLASRQPMFLAWGAERTWLYNDAFVPLLGAKHPGALGRPALGEVWSEARDALGPLFDRVFAGEPVHMDEFGLMLDRHGRMEEAHFAFSYTPVRDESGAVSGLFGVCIETTERVRAEAKLTEADRRKDEFLATLAHELRNPLAPLRNALYLARHGGRSEDDRLQAGALLGMMERQVDQMARLVDDLMDIARITQGKIALRLEPVDLGRVVSAAVETTTLAASQGGHELRVSVPSSPMHVRGDAARLMQVFSNLVNNAVKFSKPGDRIEVGAEHQGDEAVVIVTDYGIGIPVDKLEEVFEMFSQLDRSLERTKTGLGLGLALARQFVTLHGGTIEARSPGPGCGSEFVVRLPVLPPSEVGIEAPAPAPNVSVRQSRRILVADDNHDAADSIAMLLDDAGHDVEVVYNGLDALETANRTHPDVMLLDIGMPGMNGYDVARSARAEAWSAETVIVALTGWGQEDDRLRSRDAGIDLHLVKPVELDRLEVALRGRRDPTNS